ncbi:DUF4259 domain-containing protein [Hyalangium sp.]|uniref:DUF4259 domain-containing protein n=1 Tax=Hyalangium sp. TaxID=2028555 RepID=UPI002D51A05B|nr:DUF4259 domain-containing protein [Hyalangium sp.]HYI01226.1 DUF4259 domain-containing protein [Hyalangium sp.]
MGTWAAGPFGNDTALNYLGGVVDRLMNSIFEFVDNPSLEANFDEAFAAIALLNILAQKVTAPLPDAAEVEVWKRIALHTYDSQIDELKPDKEYKRSQRKAIAKELDRLIAASLERKDGDEGEPLGRLGRLLLRAMAQRTPGPFTINYTEVSRWITDFSDDLERAWNECPRGDWLIGLATALGVPVRVLLPPVASLISPLLSKVPAGEQRPAEALQAAERWAQGTGTEAECARAREAALSAASPLGTVPSSVASMTAALAEAALEAAAGRPALLRDALTAAMNDYGNAAHLEAGLAAMAAGKDRLSAMLNDGIAARDAAINAAAPTLRERIPWSAVREALTPLSRR